MNTECYSLAQLYVLNTALFVVHTLQSDVQKLQFVVHMQMSKYAYCTFYAIHKNFVTAGVAYTQTTMCSQNPDANELVAQ